MSLLMRQRCLKCPAMAPCHFMPERRVLYGMFSSSAYASLSCPAVSRIAASGAPFLPAVHVRSVYSPGETAAIAAQSGRVSCHCRESATLPSQTAAVYIAPILPACAVYLRLVCHSVSPARVMMAFCAKHASMRKDISARYLFRLLFYARPRASMSFSRYAFYASRVSAFAQLPPACRARAASAVCRAAGILKMPPRCCYALRAFVLVAAQCVMHMRYELIVYAGAMRKLQRYAYAAPLCAVCSGTPMPAVCQSAGKGAWHPAGRILSATVVKMRHSDRLSAQPPQRPRTRKYLEQCQAMPMLLELCRFSFYAFTAHKMQWGQAVEMCVCVTQ